MNIFYIRRKERGSDVGIFSVYDMEVAGYKMNTAIHATVNIDCIYDAQSKSGPGPDSFLMNAHTVSRTADYLLTHSEAAKCEI